MVLKANHIHELIDFVSSLENKAFEGSLLKAQKNLNQELYTKLVKVEEMGMLNELSFKNKPIGGVHALKQRLNRNDGGEVQFSIRLPRGSDLIYTDNLDNVIRYQKFAWKKPKELVLDSLNYNSLKTDPVPDIVEAYYLIIDLINLLISPNAGNHFNEEHTDLHVYILGPNKKLQMKVDYEEKELNPLEIKKAVSKLNTILEEPAYIETKYTLLRTTLIDFLMPTSQDQRFRHLLQNISELVTQFSQNYELFLSEFRFENEREKIEQTKREYILSLNKAFDDIQNKILAIPASLLLVGSQMKFPAQIDNKTFISNTLILFGSLLFSWIMILMTRNQKNTIDAIKKDSKLRQRRIKRQLSNELYTDLNNAFSDIRDRYKKQKFRLQIVNGLVVFGFLITLVLYNHSQATPLLLEMFKKCLSWYGW